MLCQCSPTWLKLKQQNGKVESASCWRHCALALSPAGFCRGWQLGPSIALLATLHQA